jgi:hypothetical protein
MTETPNDFEVEDCEEECFDTDYVEEVLLPAMSEEERQRYCAAHLTTAAYAERYPAAEPEAIDTPTAEDFPAPYEEPPEHVLSGPIAPRPRPVPLYVQPAKPGVLPVRPPAGGGLMASRVASTVPRPSFLKPISEN